MKLRVGVLLWLLSWIPYGIVFGLSGVGLTLSWTLEVVLGISGLALAGAAFAGAVKASGWRRAPGIAWHTLMHGEATARAESPSASTPTL